LHSNGSPLPATKEIAGGYVVRDANKQALAYVYCQEPEHAANIAKVLTKDEARRIASSRSCRIIWRAQS
jgi:hypothetical protein